MYLPLFYLLLLFPVLVSAETSLWRISDGKSELFIGGTIHLLSPSDYPLPNEFEQAYNQSNLLVLETELRLFEQPEIQQMMFKQLVYQDGRTLKSVLDEKVFQILSDYCLEIKFPVQSIIHFKPSFAMLSLMMFQLQKIGLSDQGVDKYFEQKARVEDKAVVGLESVQQQIEALEHLGQGYENEFVLSSVEDMRNLTAMLKLLKNAWRSGDLVSLERLGIEPMLTKYKGVYQGLLVDRNQAWLPKIEGLIKTETKELVLVGALHLAGKDGLLFKLRKLGYRIEKYK